MNNKQTNHFWNELDLDYQAVNSTSLGCNPVSSKDIRTWFIGKELLSKPRALTDYDQIPKDSN